MKRVALIIIGDEILDGSVQDSNSAFLARRIAGVGSQVTRITVLPDDPEIVAPELIAASEANDFVITSGGIGPTPDDRTYEAFSAAFGVPLVPNPLLEAVVAKRFDAEERPWAMRMASPPEGAKLVTGGRFAWPLVRFRNLFILPGVPSILEDKFALLEADLSAEAFYTGYVKVRARESALAKDMAALIDEFPEVRVGSYPVLDPVPHVRLVVRSKDPQLASTVLDRLTMLFDDDAKIEVQPIDFT